MNNPLVLVAGIVASLAIAAAIIAIGSWQVRGKARFSAAADMMSRDNGATVSIDRHVFRGTASAHRHSWRRWAGAVRRAVVELRRPA